MRTAANAPVERTRPDWASLVLVCAMIFASGCAASHAQYATTPHSLRDDGGDRAPDRQPGQMGNIAELDHGEPMTDEDLRDGELDAVARGD